MSDPAPPPPVDATDGTPPAPADRTDDPGHEPAGDARRLFSYVVGPEWLEYRAVMAVFAGTFFAEFTPDEVAERLARDGVDLDPAVIAERLESLRRWGNLAVSSSVGSPSSLADYYRRRNRYLVTRAGQEVHDAVEAVLTRVDEVRDVSTGRLGALQVALRELAAVAPAEVDPVRLADLVRAVFDPHQAFTAEITQFFAALNQWQSRYDLSEEELAFFARVLVGYVAERLDEVERRARPIAVLLDQLAPAVPTIVERAGRGLAAEVAAAGLAEAVTVSRAPGTAVDDWDNLRAWFLGRGGRPARLAQLQADAVAAIRTLTLNLTRLSRVGVGGASRRADLVTLATVFDRADVDDLPALAHAAFGLGGSIHLGVLAADSDDPVGSTTPWALAPPAVVPVSLRERGDTTNRGRSTPLRDRSRAQDAVRRRREAERQRRAELDGELAGVDLDGATVSVAALHRLQGLVGNTLAAMGPAAARGEHAEDGLVCRVERRPGADLTVHTSDGTLRYPDLRVEVAGASSPASSPAPAAPQGVV